VETTEVPQPEPADPTGEPGVEGEPGEEETTEEETENGEEEAAEGE